MKKIKVLHVFKKSIIDNFGGIEQFIDTLCKGTSYLGVENTLFTLSRNHFNKIINRDGYKIYSSKEDFYIFSTGFSLSAFLKFKKLAKKADIVHYHFPYPFADFLHFACLINKPYVITYHSDIVKQKFVFLFYKFLMYKFLDHSKSIITTSENYFKSSLILRKYGSKVSVIPIGVNLETFPKIDQNLYDSFKKKFPKPFFLFIGSLRYYKGLDYALEALVGTDLQLVIGGAGYLGFHLKQKMKNLNLLNVTFLDEITDQEKVCLLNLCYGFLFPSNKRSEAFGIALLEAAAFGKPMISCEIGTGTSFINENNVTGLVIKPNSSIDIRKAMNYMILNPEIVKKMGIKAKERVNQIFSEEIQSEKYLRIYKNIL